MLEIEIKIADGFGSLVVAVILNYLDKLFADAANCGNIRPVRVDKIFEIGNSLSKILDRLGNARRSQVTNQVLKPLSGNKPLYVLVV